MSDRPSSDLDRRDLQRGKAIPIAAASTNTDDKWLADNKTAIDAYNKRVHEQGTLIQPIWLQKK